MLVQALAKGDRDLAAVEAATELGVDAIVPWQAERSIVVWRGDRAAEVPEPLGGNGPGRREAVPPGAGPAGRRAVVDSAALADLVGGAALALVLHEDADRPLAGVDLPDGGDVLVVVGPEGGIGAAELPGWSAAGAVARAARRHRAAVLVRRPGRARRAQRHRPLALDVSGR